MAQRTLQLIGSMTLVLMVLALRVAPARAAGTVGSGTPASCTSAALADAIQGGGVVTFNCGASPVTIVVDATLDISAPATTIDGGGLVTLSGGGQRQIILHRSLSSVTSLTLRNLTIRDGTVTGAGAAANGAAVESIFQGANPSFKPTLIIEQVSFINNVSSQTSGGTTYDFGGGAIYSRGGSVTVSGSDFTGNRADNGAGGAIHILQSALSISGSSFSDNRAIGGGQGGAIYIDGLGGAGSIFTLADSSFTNNQTHNSGGAIYVNMYEDSSGMSVDRSSFTNNAVVGGNGAQGGAISGGGTTIGAGTGNPQITISNSTFAGNSVRRSASPFDGSGGALAFAQRAAISISNSTFSANRAEGSSFNANGGALYVVNNTTPFSLTNVTFADNHAGWVGGAVSNSQISGQPGGVVRNTIFANNSADNGGNNWSIQQHCSSELTDSGNTLQYPPRNNDPFTFNEVTCLAGKSAIGQRSLTDFSNPQLLTLADTGGPTQTIGLAHTSPALNAGNPATCPATDQRGVVRSGTCDIGAHEFSAVPYVAALSPGFAEVGQAGLTLTVLGADYDPGSAVLWGGSARTTEFVNSGQLRASILAADLSAIGPVSVSARNSSSTPASTSRIFQVLAEVFGSYLPLVVR